MNVYGIIGDPVDHSLSPVIHGQFFHDCQINGEYKKIFIPKSELEKEIERLRCSNIKGFNVTIPHKTAILPLLDEVEESARLIGAVNTVVRKNGKLIGHNTDGSGFIRSLKGLEANFKGKSIAIIGAGGAARAVYDALIREGAQNIDVGNRTIENGERMIAERNAPIKSQALSLEQLAERVGQYEILVQTTSVGMHPNDGALILPLDGLKKGTIVIDIIYRPTETKFLKAAKNRGAVTENGINMLLHQAAQSFYLWTGRYPDIESARRAIMKQVKKGV